MMRGRVKVCVNRPSVDAVDMDPLSNDMVPTSKRTEFVMLKTSQRKLRFFDSLIFQVFDNAESIPKYPGPRKALRCPDSPG